MLGALQAVHWPPPIGGKTALAKSSFEFELTPGVPAPTEWPQAHLEELRAALAEPLAQCHDGQPSKLQATVYFGEDGVALAAGLATSEDVSEQTGECVTEALLAAQYPTLSPGTRWAKAHLDF
jgi:hypothetical protein